METSTKVENEDEWKRFKSYYVVWKQELDNLEEYICDGLNRTMQYGNGAGIIAKNPIITGLNRTMQYGNRITTHYLKMHFRV